MASYRAFNSDAWERLYSVGAGRTEAPAYKLAARDIATSALNIEELERQIGELEEAEAARRNARIEDDERNMRYWQR